MSQEFWVRNNEEYEPQNSSSDISDVKIFHGISDNMMQYICHVANVDQYDEIFFKCLIYELWSYDEYIIYIIWVYYKIWKSLYIWFLFINNINVRIKQ